MSIETVTLKETSTILNVSYQTLMQWLRDGSLSGEKRVDGRREVWRIPVSEVERIRDQRIAELQAEIDALVSVHINGQIYHYRPRDEWPDSSLKAWGNAVKTRDGWRCRNCGAGIDETGTQSLHAHHIIPRSDGGKNVLGNGITLCLSCHTAAHKGSGQDNEAATTGASFPPG